MAEKYLIVVDMQKDFVDGSLGTKEAEAIVNNTAEKIRNFSGTVIFTRDTHQPEYLDTQEGAFLPVVHCVENTEGWQIIKELQDLASEAEIINKPTFGSTALAEKLKNIYDSDGIESIELIGLCTDICVVSNALLLKAVMPEVPILVDSSCCAGVTPAKHEAALETMRSCQITVL